MSIPTLLGFLGGWIVRRRHYDVDRQLHELRVRLQHRHGGWRHLCRDLYRLPGPIRGVGSEGHRRVFIKGKADRKLLTVETGKIIRWGYLVKKSGLLALEKEIKGTKNQDHFLTYGIELVITGYSGDEVRGMLGAASNGAYSRAMVQADILQNMAAAAPAFGMIGTLVGLIVMLQSLTANPDGVGDGLAVAMLTTLYGVLVARLVFIPAASKISQKEGIMRFRNFLITEGFAMLAEQKSPRFIQDKMNSYLDPSIHYNIDKKGSKKDE